MARPASSTDSSRTGSRAMDTDKGLADRPSDRSIDTDRPAPRVSRMKRKGSRLRPDGGTNGPKRQKTGSEPEPIEIDGCAARFGSDGPEPTDMYMFRDKPEPMD